MQSSSQVGGLSGRSQQVTDLVSRIISCRPLNRDQSLFEIPLWLSDGKSTAVRVTLPPAFPQAAPSIAVTSPLRHPNINSAGQLSFHSLSAWNPHTSRLADVVEEACTLISSPADDDWQLVSAASGPSIPSTSAASDLHSSQQRNQHNHRSPNSRSASPVKGQHQSSGLQTSNMQDFPELASFSNEELAALLVNDTKYRELVGKIMAKSSVAQIRASVRKGIVDMASSNLEKEQLISEVKNHIAIVRSSEYAAAKEQFDSRLQRQSAALAKLKPEVLISKLAKASREADDEAEALYEDFVRGDLTVESFVGAYSKKKAVAHSRDLKSSAAMQTIQ